MGYLSPEQSQEKRNARMDVARGQFLDAERLALDHDLVLIRRSRVHYQLFPLDKRWILNIYPSNRRLYHDPNKRGPFLDVPDDWTLLDVVQAAVAKVP